MTYPELIEKMRNQDVYLEHPVQEVVIRYVSSTGKFFAKRKGSHEWSLHFSTETVNECLLEANEITEKEYGNY